MIGRDLTGWHDVYKTSSAGKRIYLHFYRPSSEEPMVIAAFKRDADSDP